MSLFQDVKTAFVSSNGIARHTLSLIFRKSSSLRDPGISRGSNQSHNPTIKVVIIGNIPGDLDSHGGLN